MTEILTAQPMELPQLTPEQDQEIYEALDYGSPREAQARLNRYFVQKALRLDFRPTQHIYCATDSDRGWFSRIQKVRHSKYKSMAGLVEAYLEIEAAIQGVEEFVYGD